MLKQALPEMEAEVDRISQQEQAAQVGHKGGRKRGCKGVVGAERGEAGDSRRRPLRRRRRWGDCRGVVSGPSEGCREVTKGVVKGVVGAERGGAGAGGDGEGEGGAGEGEGFEGGLEGGDGGAEGGARAAAGGDGGAEGGERGAGLPRGGGGGGRRDEGGARAGAQADKAQARGGGGEGADVPRADGDSCGGQHGPPHGGGEAGGAGSGADHYQGKAAGGDRECEEEIHGRRQEEAAGVSCQAQGEDRRVRAGAGADGEDEGASTPPLHPLYTPSTKPLMWI
eukprot:467082-Prorocentrum_minimum.AAC.2